MTTHSLGQAWEMIIAVPMVQLTILSFLELVQTSSQKVAEGCKKMAEALRDRGTVQTLERSDDSPAISLPGKADHQQPPALNPADGPSQQGTSLDEVHLTDHDAWEIYLEFASDEERRALGVWADDGGRVD